MLIILLFLNFIFASNACFGTPQEEFIFFGTVITLCLVLFFVLNIYKISYFERLKVIAPVLFFAALHILVTFTELEQGYSYNELYNISGYFYHCILITLPTIMYFVIQKNRINMLFIIAIVVNALTSLIFIDDFFQIWKTQFANFWDIKYVIGIFITFMIFPIYVLVDRVRIRKIPNPQFRSNPSKNNNSYLYIMLVFFILQTVEIVLLFLSDFIGVIK
jgi:hypothetical protein